MRLEAELHRAQPRTNVSPTPAGPASALLCCYGVHIQRRNCMRVIISTSASVPIYEQIKTQARSAILSGEVQTGSTLPSLRQLAAELRVSVITVTRAYNDLVAEGLVRNE